MRKKHLFTRSLALLALAVFISGCPSGPKPKTATSSSSVVVVKVIIDDSTGNKDGMLTRGESVKMRLQLKNTGAESIPGGQATLSTTQPGVHISDSLGTFPQIPPQIPGSGGTVFQFQSDPFAFSIDDTVSAPSVIFLLKSPFYSTLFAVQVHTPIYACVEKCEIIRGAPDHTLKISLSICNEMPRPSPNAPPVQLNVAVEIPEGKIFLCGISNLPFTFVKDIVFFGNVDSASCAIPVNCFPPQEFIYTFSTGTNLPLPADDICVRFMSRIYTDASFDQASCSTDLSTAVTLKEMEACSRAPIHN